MAIRDQSYTPYDGPLRSDHGWAVIAWNGVRTYWRFWRMKLTLFAVWIVPVVFALLILAEALLIGAVGSKDELPGPSHVGVSLFIAVQLFALALVFIARGCSIISDDLRHQTMPLYFSKPITRLDYGLGKLSTLLFYGFVSVILPALILGSLRTLFFIQTDHLMDIVALHLRGLVLLVLMVVMLSSLVIGLSSLTRRGGYAVLAWIGLLIVPLIIQAIVGATVDDTAWTRMLSIQGIVGLAADSLMGGAEVMPDEIPRAVPFVAIFGLIGAGLGALYWRIDQLGSTA